MSLGPPMRNTIQKQHPIHELITVIDMIVCADHGEMAGNMLEVRGLRSQAALRPE